MGKGFNKLKNTSILYWYVCVVICPANWLYWCILWIRDTFYYLNIFALYNDKESFPSQVRKVNMSTLKADHGLWVQKLFFLPVQEEHSCVQCLCTIISEISELHFEAQAGAKSMCKLNGHFLWCISANFCILVSCFGKPFLTRKPVSRLSVLLSRWEMAAKQPDFARGGNNVIMGVLVTCLQLPTVHCPFRSPSGTSPYTYAHPRLFPTNKPPTSTSSLSHKTAL